MTLPSAQNSRALFEVKIVSFAASSCLISPTPRARPASADRRSLIKVKAKERGGQGRTHRSRASCEWIAAAKNAVRTDFSVQG